MTCNLCGESVPPESIMEHLRLFHPDQYGDGEVEDGIAEPPVTPGIETARIAVVRRVTEDDVLDFVEAVDGEGSTLPLTEALGMLRLAEDTLIREAMGEGD